MKSEDELRNGYYQIIESGENPFQDIPSERAAEIVKQNKEAGSDKTSASTCWKIDKALGFLNA